MTRRSIPSSHLLRIGAAILIAAIAPAPTTALATVVTSAANIPFSGISPGGVDMATGEIIIVCRPDLAIDGPVPLVYRRYYASMLAREGLASGHMGPNWLGTYDWRLSVVGTNATLVTNQGAAIRFTQIVGGGWNLVSPTYAKFKLDQISGGTWRFTNPLDRRIYFFDGVTWLLTQVLDEHGNALTLTYTGGLLTQVTDGLGRMLSFSYDASNHLTQVSDGTRSVHYNYATGVLTGFIDANSQIWGYATQPGPNQGLLIGVMEPAGNTPFTQAYDASGRVSSQTDAFGNMGMYAYDLPSGNTFTDPLSNTWTYQHDAQNRLMTRMDPMGGPTSYGYDPQGRVQMVSRPMGDPTSFAYDASSGYLNMVTLADGPSFSWGYTSHLVGGATLFDLATASYPDGTTESYGRDAAGNLTDLMDQAGLHWLGTYNAFGQLLTWTNPSAGVTTFTYDPQGRPATGKDNAGNTTHYAYDPLSRLMGVTWPDGTAQSYAHDNLDAMTNLTDERGKLWSWGHDANERRTSATDPLLEPTGYGYDAADRLTSVSDPLGHSTLYEYDQNGRLKSFTDRSGRKTSYQYDALNRLMGVMDPAGGTDLYGYDPDSRVTSEQDALGHGSSFTYNFRDLVTHVTDPVGSGFDYGYDSMGRLHTGSGPLGTTQTYNYDARGFLAAFLDGTFETDFPRTPLGEIDHVQDPNRNVWPRGYDKQGRLTSASDPLGRGYAYQYDALSRPNHIQRPDGSDQQINYDAAGRITGMIFGAGPSFSYGYDDANRLTSATGASFAYDAAGRMTNSNGFAMTYDNDGRLLTETLAPGKAASYSYESRGLPFQVMDWIGGMTSFTHDAARRLTGITRPNGTSATYGYDNADRLTSEVEAGPGPTSNQLSSIAITRDALGQPASINRRQPLMPGETSPGSGSFSYDAASQLNGAGHDLLGRTTSAGSRSFQWDGASRLTRYFAGSDSPSYAYDAFAQPLTATQGSQVVQQAWNYGWQHPDYDDTQVNLPGPKTTYFVHAPSGVLLYGVDGSSGSRSFYHYDESGNTSFLTNNGGSVTTEYAYSPFGGVKALGETADNPFTYQGAAGVAQLGGSGAFRVGGGIYDANTMRMISGNTIASGPGERDPGPAGSPAWGLRNPGPTGSPAWGLKQPGPSGFGEVYGNDMVVSLASSQLGSSGLLVQSEAGTLMHELGHTFGLDHGGKDPGPVGSPGSQVEIVPNWPWRDPGPNGSPGAAVEIVPPWPWSWKNPGPNGSPGAAVEIVPPWPWSWKDPGPGGFGWKAPGPPGFGWRQPGPNGFGWKQPGPNGFGWKNPGPTGFGWRNPGPSGEPNNDPNDVNY